MIAVNKTITTSRYSVRLAALFQYDGSAFLNSLIAQVMSLTPYTTTNKIRLDKIVAFVRYANPKITPVATVSSQVGRTSIPSIRIKLKNGRFEDKERKCNYQDQQVGLVKSQELQERQEEKSQ
jgi:hypothetical protein